MGFSKGERPVGGAPTPRIDQPAPSHLPPLLGPASLSPRCNPDRVAGQLHWGFGGIGEKRYSLAEARAAPLFHVKVEVILVGIIGLWPENGAEFMTGFIVHMLHELGLRVRGRLRSDWGR